VIERSSVLWASGKLLTLGHSTALYGLYTDHMTQSLQSQMRLRRIRVRQNIVPLSTHAWHALPRDRITRHISADTIDTSTECLHLDESVKKLWAYIYDVL